MVQRPPYTMSIGSRSLGGRPLSGETNSMHPFQSGDTFSTLRQLIETVTREIEALANDYVLKPSVTELEAFFVGKVTVDPLRVDPSTRYIESQRGTSVDVGNDFRRGLFSGERSQVRGTALVVALPFSGDAQLWRLQPSSYGISGYPDIEVVGGLVKFVSSFADDAANPNQIKTQIDQAVTSLANGAASVARDVEQHNSTAPAQIRAVLERKRSKAQSVLGAVAALGIPMKARDGATTFEIPAKRKQLPVSCPAVTQAPFEPEPVLAQAEFDNILRIIRNMSLVMERSPGTFASINEEAIRTIFLLHLNGTYDGAASGETFNAEGKTDILIRVNNSNVFIAECKFWRGPKSFDEAMEQLLGYLSWRDSKCALLIFNKTQDSSAVRQKMHEVMTARIEYRKRLPGSDAEPRYILVKASDPGREIQVCTML